MNLFILGDGSYVTGRKTSEYGVIFPAICEFINENNNVNSITFFSNSKLGQNQAKKKINSILKKTQTKTDVSYVLGFSNMKNIINKYKSDSLNCAFVCTPDHTHYNFIKAMLKNKLHTFSVKPFVLKTDHALKLIKIQKKYNLISYVDFHKRFDFQNIITKDKILNKKIGHVLNINVSYSQKKINPEINFKKWANKTNILQYLGIHYIDLTFFMTKARPKRVMAVGQVNYLKSKLKKYIYDSIQCIIEWEDKNKKIFTQTLSVNWIDPNSSSAMSEQNYTITGSFGNINCEQKKRGLTITTDGNGINDINPDFCINYSIGKKLKFDGYGIKSIKTFLYDVINFQNKKTSLKNIEETRPTFSQSLVSTKVIDAANKSLKSKSRWVFI